MSLAWLLNVCFPVSAWEDSGRFVLFWFVVVLTKYGEEGFFFSCFVSAQAPGWGKLGWEGMCLE